MSEKTREVPQLADAPYAHTLVGPMKGVIPTPNIAKIFHPTPDIQAKK